MPDANAAPAAVAGGYRAVSWRGAEGFFRAGRTNGGDWALLDPDGAPFFCRAVHGVRPPVEQGEGLVAPDSIARLRRWGFNALGAGAYPGSADDGLPWLGVVDFVAAAPAITAGTARLPDVFSGDWPRLAAARARDACGPRREDRQLLGWISDDALGWAQPGPAGRPSLLQLCLSLEPGFAAYHAAWEFVLALHGGALEAVARAWGTALPNKEVVRERTRSDEGLGTRGYLRDDARWTREFARRYFNTAAAAIRAADPHHLYLGARHAGPPGPVVAGECGFGVVDVQLRDWRDLPPADREPAGPVLANDVTFATAELMKLPPAARVLRLTSVEWMLRRARAALERMARHPAVVGYAWAQWQDEPGEQPPFGRGLVHVNGAEAREHTELLVPFNARVEPLRRQAGGAVFQV